MATQYTYPHWETNVVDQSTYIPLIRETLPLFRPLFFMRAQKGKVGVPMWVPDYTRACQYFGNGTFDPTTPYFSRESLYLEKLFSRQGAFVVRLASSDATVGTLVLELRVKSAKVPQYKRDASGQYILDPVTQERIPETDPQTGAAVTADGYELKWQTRELRKNSTGVSETIVNLKPTTYGVGQNAYTVYPILAISATSVGAYANDTGVKFFVDVDDMDRTLAENIKSIVYTFGAVSKTYGQDTVSAIQSNFGNQYENFVAKPNQTDTRVARNVSFDDVMGNEYNDVLPWDIHLYSENIQLVGQLIMDIEGNDEITDPYMVNLATALDFDGSPYTRVILSDEDDSIYLNDTRILYLKGGSDGTMADATIEELTRQYLMDLVYPEILDQARYPFTHIIDTGVSITTKRAFIQFLGHHDAFKVILATQDANMGRFNTKNEDMSMGASLFAECLLQPESIEKGTECCRAEIYQQAGYLADGSYKGIIPSTIDVMMKKSQYQSTQTITGQAAGLPNSQITVFKEWNWTPCDADHKQRSWESGLNYFQYYDTTSIHWPAMRSVYRYDTSVLTNSLFTDVVVYTKHIVRYNWSRYVGVELDFALLSTRATASVTNDLNTMLNGFYRFTVSFSQSDEEARIGYISHATIELVGKAQQRVWKTDIVCKREGYEETAEV